MDTVDPRRLVAELFGPRVARALQASRLPADSLAKSACEAWGRPVPADLAAAPALSEKAAAAVRHLAVLAKAQADAAVLRALAEPPQTVRKSTEQDAPDTAGEPSQRPPKPPQAPLKAPPRVRPPLGARRGE